MMRCNWGCGVIAWKLFEYGILKIDEKQQFNEAV